MHSNRPQLPLPLSQHYDTGTLGFPFTTDNTVILRMLSCFPFSQRQTDSHKSYFILRQSRAIRTVDYCLLYSFGWKSHHVHSHRCCRHGCHCLLLFQMWYLYYSNNVLRTIISSIIPVYKYNSWIFFGFYRSSVLSQSICWFCCCLIFISTLYKSTLIAIHVISWS